MSPSKRYAKKQAKARQRRRLQAHERLERDRRQAQRVAEALHQALEDVGLPANLVREIEGRLRSQHTLLGKIVGVMFPALFGCRTPSELCRVRGWDPHWPSRILGALPKRSWLKRLRRLAVEVLEPLWHHVAHKSPATQSRWQWTWVWDDSVFHKSEDTHTVGTRRKKGIESRLGGETLCLSHCGYTSWRCSILPTSRPVRPCLTPLTAHPTIS